MKQWFQIQLHMSRIITKIDRVRGLDYRVDKEGNIIEEKYNWLKDKTTLVMIVILVLGGLYYVQMSQSETNADNFDEYCMMYSQAREAYVLDNPGVEVKINNVLEYYTKNVEKLNGKLDIDINNG